MILPGFDSSAEVVGDRPPVHTWRTSFEIASSLNSHARMLVIDDEPSSRDLMARILTRDGHDVETAADGESGWDASQLRTPDLILLDVHLPGVDGFTLCRRFKRASRTRFVPVVLVTGFGDREHRMRGIEAGADDFLAKPFDIAELTARVRALVKLKRRTDRLESVDAILRSLARTIEARDPYTQGHCERLSQYAVTVGRHLKLTGDNLWALDHGAYLHDVGKIGVPDALLLKQGKLTPDEYEIVKQHTVIGDQLCSELRSLTQVRQIVRHHHELLDGSGYPDGLSGDAIPLLAQIVGIADLYDAMTTDRPNRRALTSGAAFDALSGDVARGQRRADLVEVFIDLGHQGAFLGDGVR
jgi:putative two-component system response regulator